MALNYGNFGDEDWLRNTQNSTSNWNNMSGMTLPASYTTENDGIAERLAKDNLVNLQGTRGSNYYTGATTPFGKVGDYFSELGITGDGMKGVGSLIGGLGGLAQGWASLKNARLARDAYDTQKDQWQQNYESQRTAVNNQIANQNAWKQAQGRQDYGSYVGGKPSGTNYVG